MTGIVHKTYDYREFLLTFRYLDLGPEDGGMRPHMVLDRKGNWYTIADKDMHYLADSKTGDPTPYLIGATVEAAEHLGLTPTRDTCRRIADAIVDGIPDLIAMPPWESYQVQLPKVDPIGEVEIEIGGERITVEIPGDLV